MGVDLDFDPDRRALAPPSLSLPPSPPSLTRRSLASGHLPVCTPTVAGVLCDVMDGMEVQQHALLPAKLREPGRGVASGLSLLRRDAWRQCLLHSLRHRLEAVLLAGGEY